MDEAHKLSAAYFGNELKKTKRFQLGELLGGVTRHFLLMTATPHNGKEEDFQAWLSLLDSDRFYGKSRDGARKVDVDDLMRRMVKEEMLRFDGTRLFPERRAYTVNYQLSNLEAALYEAVTSYVKEEMGKAERLGDDKRKGNVGFALTSLAATSRVESRGDLSIPAASAREAQAKNRRRAAAAARSGRAQRAGQWHRRSR